MPRTHLGLRRRIDFDSGEFCGEFDVEVGLVLDLRVLDDDLGGAGEGGEAPDTGPGQL